MAKIESWIYVFENDEEKTIHIESDLSFRKKYNEKDVWKYVTNELPSTLKKYIRDDGKRKEIVSKAEKCFMTINMFDDEDAYISIRNGFYEVMCYNYSDVPKVEIVLRRKKRK